MISRCSSVAPWASSALTSAMRLVQWLACLRAVDQRGHLHQLEEAGHRVGHVDGGVQAHLAQPAAGAGDRVQQLVAHDPERGVQSLGRAEQLLLAHLFLSAHRGARVGQQWRRPGRGAVARFGPGQHDASSRARDGHVQAPARAVPRVAWLGQAFLEQLGGHAVGGRGGIAAVQPRCREADHEHVVELPALGGLDRQDLDRRPRVRDGRLVLRQPGVRYGLEVAGELARGGAGLAAHVSRGQLGQHGHVAQPLDGVGLRGEHLLAADADALDQPQDEGVGAAVLERRRSRAVQAQEGLRAVAPLGGQLRALERQRHGRGHVELAPARELGQPRDVHRVQADRRPRERAHGRTGVGRVGQQPHPRQHVAHLRALEVGRRAGQHGTASRAPPARRPPPARRSTAERTSTAMPAGSAPAMIARSASAATACACARSDAQRQNRTWPSPPAGASALGSRPAAGATTASAAASTGAGQRLLSSSRSVWDSGKRWRSPPGSSPPHRGRGGWPGRHRRPP